ncbi:Palmitoyl-acyl carrier protein like [Actinidia chinensis var. chinensis]|uniref:Acyl-[acyl-carrier-protein] hydrolase n=1 Tax=Actinidia chinensis var. chinensis TaxID=1590841 RepID=A0A2R6R4E5_ACTCC|nr:Palmitoyl-acyl carrier protein like [Actinidia chinensis var. chinensis]
MVAAAATNAFFPVASLPPESGAKTSSKLGGVPATVDTRGTKSNAASSARLKVKTNAQAPLKVNGTRVGVMESLKCENETVSPAPRTFINQLPDWGMLLAAITTMFLAAEKQWMMLDWKPRRPDILIDPFGLGKIVQDGLVFRQNFSIRSYEIGADRTASIETLMNHLQETALNHVKTAGLLGDGFGSTPEMCKKNLIWVVTKMQVLVDRYPTWGDVVQVDTWVAASGKNGMRRDWLVRDCKTGDILTRASSVWVMMNKVTRRLSKLPDEVRLEIGPYFVDSPPVVDEDNRKLPKLDENTADYIRAGLTPKWSDLDVNQHVNNVKYIGWILESAPILETHELSSMTLEYRRECGKDSVLQSLTAVSAGGDGGKVIDFGPVECQHLLRLEGGAEIVKARTEWRPKHVNDLGSLGQLPAESA